MKQKILSTFKAFLVWAEKYPRLIFVLAHVGCTCPKHRMRRAAFDCGLWGGITGGCLAVGQWLAAVFAFILFVHAYQRGSRASYDQRNEDMIREAMGNIESIIEGARVVHDEPHHQMGPM